MEPNRSILTHFRRSITQFGASYRAHLGVGAGFEVHGRVKFRDYATFAESGLCSACCLPQRAANIF
jgi:hypothetical protein